MMRAAVRPERSDGVSAVPSDRSGLTDGERYIVPKEIIGYQYYFEMMLIQITLLKFSGDSINFNFLYVNVPRECCTGLQLFRFLFSFHLTTVLLMPCFPL
jgi:hypothetical protein